MNVNRESRSCVICKAPAAKYRNFGVETCDACKIFFWRALQKDAYKAYRCLSGGGCVIDVDARRLCSFCRFRQCRDAGMDIIKPRRRDQTSSAETSQVLPLLNASSGKDQKLHTRTSKPTREDELDSAARELFQELLTLTNCRKSNIIDKSKFFTMMEIFDLDTLNSKYSYSFYNINLSQDLVVCSEMNAERMSGVLTAIVNRIIFFANSITQFAGLSPQDRQILFREASTELCMINSVLTFDDNLGIWLNPTNKDTKFYKNIPGVCGKFLETFLGPEVMQEKRRVTLLMQKHHPDETVIMLLYIILLFTPNRPGLSDVKSIQANQIHFALLLRKYLRWRFGTQDGDQVFATLTRSLMGFRRVAPIAYERVVRPVLQSVGHVV